MKDFLSRIFKKKSSEAKPVEAAEGSKKEENKPEAKTEAKPEAKAEVKPEAKEKPETKPEPKIESVPEVAAKESAPKSAAPVLVPLYGKKEEAPVAAPDTQLQPHQHLPFEGELQAVIQTLVDDLADVYPQTFEQWEDGFRRDENPEQEIAAWTHVAAVLKAASEKYNFALPEKKECFAVLIACFTGSRDTVRHRAKPQALSEEQVDQVITYFYEGGY